MELNSENIGAEINTVRIAEQQYGNIPWHEVNRSFNTLSLGNRGRIADLLTGNPDPNSPIPSGNPNVRAFAYYLYCLRKSGEDFFKQYFIRVVDERLQTSKRPVSAVIPVFYGMRAEHEALGETGQELDYTTAKDFSKFMIYVSFEDFNYLLNEDITGALEFLLEPFKKSFWSVLKEFPFLGDLAEQKDASAYQMQTFFKGMNTLNLTKLLGYLRYQISEKRVGFMGGITSFHIPKAKIFIRHLEQILTERMAKAITEGKKENMPQHIADVVYQMLRAPLEAVCSDENSVMHQLKEIKKPIPKKTEKTKQKMKLGWGIAAETAAIFSAIEHIFDSAGLARFGRKTDKN